MNATISTKPKITRAIDPIIRNLFQKLERLTAFVSTQLGRIGIRFCSDEH